MNIWMLLYDLFKLTLRSQFKIKKIRNMKGKYAFLIFLKYIFNYLYTII